MKQTKKQKHNKNIKLEIDINSVTSKPKKTHNNKILIKINNV